jgi:hypothetical protein
MNNDIQNIPNYCSRVVCIRVSDNKKKLIIIQYGMRNFFVKNYLNISLYIFLSLVDFQFLSLLKRIKFVNKMDDLI